MLEIPVDDPEISIGFYRTGKDTAISLYINIS